MKKKIVMDEKKFYNTLFNSIIANIVFVGLIGISVVDSNDLVSIVVYCTAIVGGVLAYWLNKRKQKVVASE